MMLLVKELLARGARSAITADELEWYNGLTDEEREIIVPGRRPPEQHGSLKSVQIDSIPKASDSRLESGTE